MIWVDNVNRGTGGATQIGTATIGKQHVTVYQFGGKGGEIIFSLDGPGGTGTLAHKRSGTVNILRTRRAPFCGTGSAVDLRGRTASYSVVIWFTAFGSGQVAAEDKSAGDVAGTDSGAAGRAHVMAITVLSLLLAAQLATGLASSGGR